jgi:hypothetical protein
MKTVAMRLAQGGKFHHGFLSGFVSSLGGSYTPEINGVVNTAMAGVLGGTAEVLGGGKFANGAVTGAFVYLLNHLAHTNTKGEGEKTTKTETSGSKGDELPSTYGYKNGEQVTVNGQKYQLHNCSWVKLSGDMVDAAAFPGRTSGRVYMYIPDNMIDRALIEADKALVAQNAFAGMVSGAIIEYVADRTVTVPSIRFFGMLSLYNMYKGIYSQVKANISHDNEVIKIRQK